MQTTSGAYITIIYVSALTNYIAGSAQYTNYIFFAKRKGESQSVQTEKKGVARNNRRAIFGN